MKHKIRIDDEALIGRQRVKVTEPYKVTGYWNVVIIDDVDPKNIGESRVVSGGTIAMFRVKSLGR